RQVLTHIIHRSPTGTEDTDTIKNTPHERRTSKAYNRGSDHGCTKAENARRGFDAALADSSIRRHPSDAAPAADSEPGRVLCHVRRGLRSPGQTQLVEDATHVVLDRLLRQEQLLRDFTVGVALGKAFKDFALLIGKR